MASAAKVALMLTLVSAMVMAAQAGTKYVKCKNDYCQPMKLNNVEVEVGVEVSIPVDELLGEIVCEVTNTVGELVTGTYTCPSSVTSVSFLSNVDGIVAKVVDGTVASLFGVISIVISLTLQVLICV